MSGKKRIKKGGFGVEKLKTFVCDCHRGPSRTATARDVLRRRFGVAREQQEDEENRGLRRMRRRTESCEK